MVLDMETKEMNTYRVSFSYDLPEWGDVELPANNSDDAKVLATQYFADTYPDCINLQIREVEEII